jgi:hypothetical protein
MTQASTVVRKAHRRRLPFPPFPPFNPFPPFPPSSHIFYPSSDTQHASCSAPCEGEVQHPIRSDHGLLIDACKRPATELRDCSYSDGHERMLPSGTPRREIIATGLLLVLAVFCCSACLNLPCDRCKRHHGPFR